MEKNENKNIKIMIWSYMNQRPSSQAGGNPPCRNGKIKKKKMYQANTPPSFENVPLKYKLLDEN